MHFGASNNEIVVDGHSFQRNLLSHGEFARMRTVLIDALIKVGVVKRKKKHA